MQNLVGQSIGRYQITGQIGKGGMAIVYKAFDTELERYVAIKMIRSDQVGEEEFIQRFKREARALARLSHPNIVKVLDYGEHEGIPYLIMEFIPGGELKLPGKPIPYQKAAALLAPIGRALEYAHNNNIIHRDVKPSNFLISESGVPMLSDFGIAKMLESEGPALTQTGVGYGTPDYMAPEQGLGKSAIDGRTDIYALGMVFYVLVTGIKPFSAETPLATVMKQVNDPLPLPKSVVPDLPDAVEQVLLKALAKNPDYRYQSMGNFAQALEAFAQGQTSGDLIGASLADADAISQAKTQVLTGAAVRKPALKKAPLLVLVPVAAIILLCMGIWLAYLANICLPPGAQPSPPWCEANLPKDYNRLVCPPPGPWPLPPWCAVK